MSVSQKHKQHNSKQSIITSAWNRFRWKDILKSERYSHRDLKFLVNSETSATKVWSPPVETSTSSLKSSFYPRT